jgi:hypothetical protein
LRHDKYYLLDETIALLDDAFEMEEKYSKGDVVSSPYHNAFTPEMKNYNLFVNKRGY